MNAPKSTTSAALERAVEAAGHAWAIEWADALRREGRAVAGGWPGTLSEARVRVVACARQAGRQRTTTHAELERLTKKAYEAARTSWLSRCEPEPAEPGESRRFGLDGDALLEET